MRDRACRLDLRSEFDSSSFSRSSLCDLVDKCKTCRSRAHRIYVHCMITEVLLAVTQSMWSLTLTTCWGTWQRGGWSREEVWEEKCTLLGAQKWKDWETCSEVRVRGRERVGLGLECVYGTEVTVCACHVNFCLCIFSLPGQVCIISFPHLNLNPVEQAWLCVCECMGVYMYWYLCVLSLDPWIAAFRLNLTDKLQGCLQAIG